MRWTRVPEVIAGQLALLAANAALTSEIGSADAIRERMSQDEVSPIPGVFWYMLPLTATETTEETIIRYDIYALGTAQAFLIEGYIRDDLHFEYPVEINDVVCWSQFRQSFDVNEGIQGQDDIAHRVVEIAISPVRQRART